MPWAHQVPGARTAKSSAERTELLHPALGGLPRPQPIVSPHGALSDIDACEGSCA